jgi:multidrug efflux pump subunit AcrA (membrane-fusion protein)
MNRAAPVFATPLLCLSLTLALVGCSAFSGKGGGSTSTPAVTVAVSGPATTRLNGTSQFTATVSNTSNKTVSWQVNGIGGGNATVGTIA